MGQSINVTSTRVVGDVAVVEGDRSISGQDGAAFSAADQAATGTTLPARLATRVFEAVGGVDHVFVGSNGVVVRRAGGWDDAALRGLEETVAGFFVYYDENRS
jgi:hypothetical protein